MMPVVLLRRVVQIVLIASAIGFFAGASVSPSWIQAHFLPDFTISSSGRVAREAFARVSLAVSGTLAFAALRAVRHWDSPPALRRGCAAVLRVGAAILLALIAGEVVLRAVFWRPFDPLCCGREPLRQYDALLGWRPVPSRTATVTVAERAVTYTFDADGRRIKDSATTLDPDRPSVVFAGESFMMGYKLPWAETIPGQVEAMTGVQSVNLAVEGYSSSQAFLRLRQDLPNFRQPVAIVFLFLPSVFRKDIDRTRPRLDPELHVIPREAPMRLTILANWLVPYESRQSITEGVHTTQHILRAVADLAKARGSLPVTLVPDVAYKRGGELEVRRRVLDDAHLPYLLVPLQSEWHVPDDEHPDSRGDQAMATAVTDALRAWGLLLPHH